MTNYKHGDWYCKPKTEEEAKEILDRAVSNGAILRESVVPEEELFRWDMLPAWGVRKGKTVTDNPAAAHSELVNAEELTIEQVRERFPLPNKVDWTTAPHDAEFYSAGGFKKHENEAEYLWCKDRWEEVHYKPLEWHKERPVFELRPEAVQLDAEQTDTEYTHEHKGDLSTNTKCVIVSADKDKHGNIVVLNEHGFYKTVPQSEVQPIRTERDKWVKSALNTVSNTDNGHLRYFAELIYDAMTCGDLELPEVE